MKKLLAILLTLMLALTGATACADTVYTKLTIDGEVAKPLLTGFGVPEDQLGILDPILALVNALGVQVTTAQDGGEVVLDLNGKDALSLGWATDDAGVAVASTLFPNYLVTVSQETIGQFLEQVMANMPGGGDGAGGMMDVNAIMEVLGGHLTKWIQACAAAGQPGEPVTGDYVFDGVAFDTMVPIEVDVPTIKDATATLLDDLMADPAAMGMLKGMMQGMAQSSGQTFDESNFEAEFKAGFEEWMSHFPETVTAEFYTNSDGGETFCLIGESVMEGEAAATFYYDMMYLGADDMSIHCSIDGEAAMKMAFILQGTDISISMQMGEMYLGLDISFPENLFACDLYFIDDAKPLVSLTVERAEGGERTLSLDAEGKTVLAVEDIMNDQTGESVQALLGDVMGNGLGALMGVLGEEVPEIAGLMGMFSGAMAG